MVRKNLTPDGYTIVANIGNNWTDPNGGYAQAAFKLPDYNGLLDRHSRARACSGRSQQQAGGQRLPALGEPSGR